MRPSVWVGGVCSQITSVSPGKPRRRRPKMESRNWNNRGTMLDLTFDCDGLPGLNGCEVRETGGHQWQQVLQAVRLRMENDNGELPGS